MTVFPTLLRKSYHLVLQLHPMITQCGKYTLLTATQILREIKVCEFTVSKSAILSHLKALNFDFL